MMHLAVLYERGRGVAQDNSLAVTWYRRAAEAGYRPAAQRLFAVYTNGQLGEQVDPVRAKIWADRVQ
jgi:TPR repeat protein